MKKGLNNEQIVREAVRLVEEQGYEKFSLRELASRLGVKPASLYNHLSGIEEINQSVAIRAAEEMCRALSEATAGKDRESAFIDGALAYRRFAEENPELYKAFISMPRLDDKRVHEAGIKSFAPIRDIIQSYELRENECINFHRAFRSVLHGYIELTSNGFMTRGPVDRDDTYITIVRSYLEELKRKSRKESVT